MQSNAVDHGGVFFDSDLGSLLPRNLVIPRSHFCICLGRCPVTDIQYISIGSGEQESEESVSHTQMLFNCLDFTIHVCLQQVTF